MSDVTQRATELMAQLPGGPWDWTGSPDAVMLVTSHSGWRVLMGTERSGLRGAQFTFQHFIPHEDPSRKPRGTGILRAKQDGLHVTRSPRCKTVVDIVTPLAQLIKLIPNMVARLNQLETENADLHEQLFACVCGVEDEDESCEDYCPLCEGSCTCCPPDCHCPDCVSDEDWADQWAEVPF